MPDWKMLFALLVLVSLPRVAAADDVRNAGPLTVAKDGKTSFVICEAESRNDFKHCGYCCT